MVRSEGTTSAEPAEVERPELDYAVELGRASAVDDMNRGNGIAPSASSLSDAILSAMVDRSWPLAEQAEKLAELAHAKHRAVLLVHGNGISTEHDQALRDLSNGMSRQALSVSIGRYAYGLPCGGGKTTGVVALIAASEELGLGLTYAVAASQVVALAAIRRDLVEAGVDADRIGFRHSKSAAELAADAEASKTERLTPELMASTGDGDFPIMLVTHELVRGAGRLGGSAGNLELFSRHKGERRSLAIWDETLLVAASRSMETRQLGTVYAALQPHVGRFPALARWLAQALPLIRAELDRQCQQSPENRQPETLRLYHLPTFAAAETERPTWRSAVGRDQTLAKAIEQAEHLLALAGRELSVACLGQGRSGDGLIGYVVEVPEELENIAVLDASFAIREVVREAPISEGHVALRSRREWGNDDRRRDRRVIDATTHAMRTFKGNSRVHIQHHGIAASRSTVAVDGEKSAEAMRRAAEPAARAIAAAVASSERVLVFTAKDDDGPDRERRKPLSKLKDRLVASGVDINAKNAHGARLVEFLTWGQETSLNGYVECRHVVIVGAFRKHPLVLAAAYAGEQQDLAARRQVEVARSELAHYILQAMNRGSCRVVDDQGRALAMTLTLIDSLGGKEEAAAVRELLEEAMPGVVWEEVVEAGKSPSRTELAARAIADFLEAQPANVDRISKARVRQAVEPALAAAAGLAGDSRFLGRDAWTEAFERGVPDRILFGLTHRELSSGWARDGLMLARPTLS